MAEPPALEQIARRAIDGDREALNQLVRAVQGDVYGLAVRMLWNRENAEDATQEVLVRIVTRLSQFDFRSRLRTWVYRVAVNYLLDVKKSPLERLDLTFERFAADLAEGLSTEGTSDQERSILIEEVKIGCTLGMLQCLDRPHRLAYILGEILEFSGPEAAEILGLAPSAFRKRLERARESIAEFTRAHCGLVSDSASCQCNRRVSAARRLGRVRPQAFDFARDASSFDAARAMVRRVEEARRALAVHRVSHPSGPSVDFARRILDELDPSTRRADG
ncbi:MAG: RNA polymerase sigma factor [Vicinamibacterales bacterium]